MVRSLMLKLPIAALMLCAACTDDTGPSGPNHTLSTARHLDSLFAKSCANFSNATRCQVLYLASHAAALGAAPTSVVVTTSRRQETWAGYVVESGIHPFSAPFWDSTFAMVLYRDAKVTTALYVAFVPYTNGSGQMVWSQAQATLVENAAATTVTNGSGSITLTQRGNPCASVPSLPQGTSWWGVCNLATFNASLNVAFALPADIDPALETISIGPQAMNGVRDVPQGTASGSIVGDH